jgi:hypothetical protein
MSRPRRHRILVTRDELQFLIVAVGYYRVAVIDSDYAEVLHKRLRSHLTP